MLTGAYSTVYGITVNSLINVPPFNNPNAERRVYLEVKNYFPGEVVHR